VYVVLVLTDSVETQLEVGW